MPSTLAPTRGRDKADKLRGVSQHAEIPAIDDRPLAIALLGPTASGKSALAMEWAERLGGGIVSVDSAQVYRRMDIGSAKPDAAEQARVPHRLIDLREPWETYSAADFARDALIALRSFQAEGRLPLLVGGTGLYFHALLRGLSRMPEASPEVRAALADEAQTRGWPALHEELARVDPRAALRIEPGDRQRITRALEVWRVSGRAISDWQQRTAAHRFPFRVLKLALAPQSRGELHARIAARFDTMLSQGFLDEVARLRSDSQIHPELPALRAVGYRQAWLHLDGRIDAAAFRDQAIAATRQLAKRQLTWLRGVTDARWLDPRRDRGALERALEDFMASAPPRSVSE